MKCLVIVFILLSICMMASAASWDIGAVQSEGSATDIGAVQASPAAPAPSGQVIIIIMSAIPFLVFPVFIFLKKRKPLLGEY